MATDTTSPDITLSNVTVEDTAAATKRVTVEIPASVIDERLESNLSNLTTEAHLPGFRPGKAPRRLIERRFSKAVIEDTRQRLLAEAYQKAIEQENLKVLGDPVVKEPEKIELKPGEPLTFSFEIEILPDFELPSLDGIQLRKPTMIVSEEMVEGELTTQRERRGKVVPVEGDPVPGDYFFGRADILDAEGKKIGVVAESVSRLPQKDAEDRGPIGGIMVEGLGAHLAGRKGGDVVTIETTGPENHELDDVRDKPIKIEFHIQHVGRLIPLELEELIVLFGAENEQQLRDRLQHAMVLQVMSEQQDIMRRQVAKYLVEKTEMDLPQRISAAQTARTIETFRLRMLDQGIPAYAVEERMAEIREAGEERARHDLKLMFVMERLCEKFEIDVNEEELNGRIFQIARRQNVRPEQLRTELQRTGRLGTLYAQIRHEKAADRLIESGHITDVPADEWNKEMEAEKAEEAEKSGKSAEEKPKRKRKAKDE